MLIRTVFASTAVFAATSALAAPIDVSAVGGSGGNTVNAANASETDWFVAGGNLSSDDLWGERAGFGIGANQVYELWDSSGGNTDPDPDPNDDDAPQLITTITGLTGGQQYNVFVNYVRFGAGVADLDGNRGGVTAGLSLGTLTTFGAEGGGATTNGFTNSDRVGMRGALGVATASVGGEIQVFIDGALLTDDERTWYDGVAYEAVPEPGSLALLGLGGLLIARRRRA